MKKVEMEVVRFTESDVIVASTIIVSNVENRVGHDMTITRNGVTILSNNNTAPGYDTSLAEDGYGSNPQFAWSSESSSFYSLSSLLEGDNNGNPISGVDGEYVWSNGAFRRKQ